MPICCTTTSTSVNSVPPPKKKKKMELPYFSANCPRWARGPFPFPPFLLHSVCYASFMVSTDMTLIEDWTRNTNYLLTEFCLVSLKWEFCLCVIQSYCSKRSSVDKTIVFFPELQFFCRRGSQYQSFPGPSRLILGRSSDNRNEPLIWKHWEQYQHRHA